MTDTTDDLQRAAEGLIESVGELAESYHLLRDGGNRPSDALATVAAVFPLEPALVSGLLEPELDPDEPENPCPRRRKTSSARAPARR